MSYQDSAPAVLCRRVIPIAAGKLEIEESSMNLVPDTAILTSDRNLANPGGLLFLCPKEVSKGWDSKPQSSAPA